MRAVRFVAAIAACSLVAACATPMPPGPSVPVFPGDSKSPQAFQQDDLACRAQSTQVAGDPNAAQQTQAANMVVGTLLGAALGAGMGAAFGNAGAGAALGAGSGLVGGTAYGAAQAQGDRMTIQQRWDVSYQQCMYAKGNKVPGYAPAAPASAPACVPTGRFFPGPNGQMLQECR